MPVCTQGFVRLNAGLYLFFGNSLQPMNKLMKKTGCKSAGQG
jgi:hypothetical protein